jgi:hypothetical protein
MVVCRTRDGKTRDGNDGVELANREALHLRKSDEPDTMIITTATGLAALIRHLSR